MENYINKRKLELQTEYQQLINDTAFEIERLIVKKINRQKQLEAVLAELEKELATPTEQKQDTKGQSKPVK